MHWVEGPGGIGVEAPDLDAIGGHGLGHVAAIVPTACMGSHVSARAATYQLGQPCVCQLGQPRVCQLGQPRVS